MQTNNIECGYANNADRNAWYSVVIFYAYGRNAVAWLFPQAVYILILDFKCMQTSGFKGGS